ncbi:DUF58 domain-containing protein [Nocardioides sp. BP30]|uniref:DUF58 domain-containing protein n=1 Tax=Nocardioides sp. BP30 TaxID=3036374 RepID=UPI002468A8A5|nr:DUF58 domain-containing protein [Nocardioides sp. BP30]WGL53851.1 DUF58 domain-containing protein [Nocardioides sp. BP30]
MREALRGLTLRGRAFLAAGVTAIVCAVILGQPGLTRIGVLLVVLPLLVAIVVARSRYRLALTRSVVPAVAAVGQPVRVRIRVSNEGALPTAPLLLEEAVPFTLGARQRFVVRRLGRRRELDYQVRAELRGRYELGPLTVNVCDPFGLVRLGRAFSSTAPLVVTPRTVPLDRINLTPARSGTGDNRPRAFAGGSAEDVTVREYRRGDDLRRVHWRSSARIGELMVRREEQHWQARATVLLDTRTAAHRGAGSTASFEAAVSAAASVAAHLTERGYAVRLVATDGRDLTAWQQPSVEAASTATLLEALAVVQTAPSTGIEVDWLDGPGAGGLLVAVLGALDGTETAALRRLRNQSPAALALVLDVAGWGAAEPGEIAAPVEATVLLTQQGWQAAPLGAGDRLETAWRRLTVGRAGASTAVRAGGVG